MLIEINGQWNGSRERPVAEAVVQYNGDGDKDGDRDGDEEKLIMEEKMKMTERKARGERRG